MDARFKRLAQLDLLITQAEKCLRSYDLGEQNLVVLALKLQLWRAERKKLEAEVDKGAA